MSRLPLDILSQILYDKTVDGGKEYKIYAEISLVFTDCRAIIFRGALFHLKYSFGERLSVILLTEQPVTVLN